MTPISVVIITFNEEKDIARCLDSVQGVADDIVVVDSFSTDKTEEICSKGVHSDKTKGVRFVQHKFEGHIEQKNWSVTQAKYPHILSLDADEALSEELKKSILAVKNNFEKNGYYMNRLTNYCGKWIHHCGWYPDKKTRIYSKNEAEWSTDIIHEEIVFKKHSDKTFLKGDLLHYSYYTLEEHWAKAGKYAELGARKDVHRKNNFLLLRSILGALTKFLKMYLFQLGFLDGTAGFTICRISAYASYIKYLHKRKMLHG